MRIPVDSEINSLLSEPKPLLEDWQGRLRPKEKPGFQHEERSIEVCGQSGNLFRAILPRNRINTFDFSIILMFQDRDGKEYRLLRYNGRHPSAHTNKWEKEHGQQNHTFGPAFHIHRATQRYQENEYPIDGFAEITTSYHDFHSALDCFLRDNSFQRPEDLQLDFLEEVGLYDI